MTHWHARVTNAAAAVTDDTIEALAAAFDSFATVTIDADHQRLQVTFDVEAPSLRQASELALKQARSAIARTKLPWAPTAVTVQSDEDFTAEATQPRIPDMVPYADIATILGVSRQRVRELAGAVPGVPADPDFPPVVARPSSGPLYVRAHIEAYATRRNTKSGPRRTAS